MGFHKRLWLCLLFGCPWPCNRDLRSLMNIKRQGDMTSHHYEPSLLRISQPNISSLPSLKLLIPVTCIVNFLCTMKVKIVKNLLLLVYALWIHWCRKDTVQVNDVGRWLHLLVSSQLCQLSMHSKRYFHHMSKTARCWIQSNRFHVSCLPYLYHHIPPSKHTHTLTTSFAEDLVFINIHSASVHVSPCLIGPIGSIGLNRIIYRVILPYVNELSTQLYG